MNQEDLDCQKHLQAESHLTPFFKDVDQFPPQKEAH